MISSYGLMFHWYNFATIRLLNRLSKQGNVMNLNEKCLLKFLELPDELLNLTDELVAILKGLDTKND